MINLEEIQQLTDFESVAMYLNVSKQELGCYLHFVPTQKRYRTFQIPKKDGTFRTIHAPCYKLKKIQKKLSDKLLAIYEELHGNRKDVVGFRIGLSCVDGAKRHLHRHVVLNVDLEDFFTQITFPRVYGLFISEPFNLPRKAATVLAQVCTFLPAEERSVSDEKKKTHPYLPQGAPTSPVVSNFILSRLDHQLHGFARNNNIYYSRYADDLTFSAQSSFAFPKLGRLTVNGFELSTTLRKIIVDDNHFKINEEKIRCYEKTKRQVVTGLTVNEKANVSHRYLSQLRAMLHDWWENGLDVASERHLTFEHRRKAIKGKYTIQRIVEGKLAFLKQVVGDDAWIYRQLKFQYDYLIGEKEPVIFSRSSKWLDMGVYIIEDHGLQQEDCIEKIKLISSLIALTAKIHAYCMHNRIYEWCIKRIKRFLSNDLPFIEQGTAFNLKGIGLVTNAHVLHDARIVQDLSVVDSFENIEKFLFTKRHSDKNQKRLRLLFIDRKVDYAVLRIVDNKQIPCFDYSREEPKNGELILVAGYPNYHDEVMTLTYASIKGQRVIDGIVYYEIDKPIVTGNSGGPVFDEDGYVIGIATRGGKSEEEAEHAYNLVLPISYVIGD